MRCAVVHDWLTGQRGGENVLEVVLSLLPRADLHCVTHVPGTVSATIEARRPRTSWLAQLPVLRSRPSLALPLLPRAIESLDLEGYDAVLSLSHCVAVGARARGTHLLYSLSPMRYAWDAFEDYAAGISPLLRPAGSRLRGRLRAWDRRAGSRPRAIACISEHVRARVREAYGRDARVVYPPVDTEAFAIPRPVTDAFVAVSAARPNKRLEDVVRAFNELRLPIEVVGPASPRALRRLRAMAAPNVSIRGEVSREDLVRLVAGARALVHAAHEDFGLAPVEALAAGRPVIAFGRSGVRESVAPPGEPVAGVLYDDPRGLAPAVRRFLEVERDLPGPDALKERA